MRSSRYPIRLRAPTSRNRNDEWIGHSHNRILIPPTAVRVGRCGLAVCRFQARAPIPPVVAVIRAWNGRNHSRGLTGPLRALIGRRRKRSLSPRSNSRLRSRAPLRLRHRQRADPSRTRPRTERRRIYTLQQSSPREARKGGRDQFAKSAWMLASIAVVVAALYLAKGVLVPLTLAVLLSFLLSPVCDWLRAAQAGPYPGGIGDGNPGLRGAGHRGLDGRGSNDRPGPQNA